MTSALPISSMTIMFSIAPPPSPPCSSANGAPRMPSSSAKARHTAGFHPASPFTVFIRVSKS